MLEMENMKSFLETIKERIVVFDSEMIPNSLIYPA